MGRLKFFSPFLFSAIFTACCLSAASVHADDKVDNPKYTVWSKFKPGSSSTVSADIGVQGNKIHLDVTKTLVSITDDELVVQTVVKANVMGHDHTQPPTKETIPAKTDKNDFKPTGEQDVDAMGKTFKCKVWDAKGDPTAKPAGPEALSNMKATIYVSDDVPGGLVKIDAAGKAGAPMTFVLTAMEAK